MEKPIQLNSKLLMTLSDIIGMTNATIMQRTGLKNTTFYTIIKRPDEMSVQQLLQLANGLHIPVSRFFTAESTDQPDEYITNPYFDCYYDGDAMRRIVKEYHVATWTDAFRLTGITRGHIRKSLTSTTRLPVTRFLSVCDGFGIDPFTILIDPNKAADDKTKRKHKTATTDAANGSAAKIAAIPPTDLTALRREVTRLRADLAVVRRDLADMHKKYTALLTDHEELSRRVQVNIGTIHDSHLSIAAESSAIPYGKQEKQ